MVFVFTLILGIKVFIEKLKKKIDIEKDIIKYRRHFHAYPEMDGTNSDAFIILNLNIF